MHGRDKKWIQNSYWKTLRKVLGVDADNIKIRVTEISLEGVDWIQLAQDRDHRFGSNLGHGTDYPEGCGFPQSLQ
jgi:hypothetical protein